MNAERFIKKVDEHINAELASGTLSMPGLGMDISFYAGKKLRTKMFFAFSGGKGKDIVAVAAAIELLHAATLVHDDILDGTGKRRGKPAIHVKNGVAVSVLYGDYLFCRALSILAGLGHNGIIRGFSRAAAETLEGEMQEQCRRCDISMKSEEYFAIITKKSGVLFGMAARTGAICRGSDKKASSLAYDFGLNTGIIYQMIDDHLDYFGRNDRGKDKYGDLKGGIMTLPLIHLLGKCSEKEEKSIISAMDPAKSSPGRVKNVMDLMLKYDVENNVREQVLRSLDRLKKMPLKNRIPGVLYKREMLGWLRGKINGG